MKQLKLAMLVGGVCILGGLNAAEAGDHHKDNLENLKQTPGVITQVNATTETRAASQDEGAAEKEICPGCGSKETASIAYGYPSFDDELRDQLDRREIVLGGCMIPMDPPEYRCLKCGNDF